MVHLLFPDGHGHQVTRPMPVCHACACTELYLLAFAMPEADRQQLRARLCQAEAHADCYTGGE
jgi:hypothetical protein